MKHMFVVAVATASVLLPGSAIAESVQPPGDDIVVVAPTLEAWSQQVFKNVMRNLHYPELMPGRPVSTGIVAVKFACSEDGSPMGVALQKSSGRQNLDAATVRAVKRVPTLHPLPQGIGAGQQFIVKVLFSDSAYTGSKLAAKMRAEAARHNARVLSQTTNVAVLVVLPQGS